MILRYLLGSWSPNKYHQLGELSVARLLKLAGITAFLSVLLFLVLVLPALFQADAAVEGLRKTTSITLNGSLEQTTPTYLLRNPDVLVTTGDQDAFITITDSGVSVKRFIYFGDKNYSWRTIASLESIPATEIATRLATFLLPSLLFWGTLSVLGTALLFALLYSFIAYFILHARHFDTAYTDVLKVTVYAGLPSMMIFAAIPILRLGLPITIVVGFLFVLWLVLSLLGTALVSDKHVEHVAIHPRHKKKT